MEVKDIEVTEEVLEDASRLFLLFMVKERKYAALDKLRREPTISEFIIDILHGLCESDLIKLTGDKESPFETTAKGDAESDMYLDKKEVLNSLVQMIETFFYEWLEKLRTKKPKEENQMEKNNIVKRYVRPLDDEANDWIRQTMIAKGITPSEVALTYKGQSVPVYEATDEFIEYLAHSRIGWTFRYQAFWEDKFGTIREWKLHKREVKKKAKYRQYKKTHKILDRKPAAD